MGVQTIRVFVSSTFLDMQAERDRLNRFVFRELRSRCERRGVEFVGVDLRWGITEEQSRPRGTTRICLDEVDRCRPFFIGLVGERYGWVPPPDDVAASEFEQVRNGAELPAADAELLDELYVLDDTVEPALFRLRPGVRVPDDAIERLLAAWTRAGLDVAQSVTALEIGYGVFEPPARMYARFYLRQPDFIDHPDFPADFRPVFEEATPDRRARLAALKTKLRSQTAFGVREYSVEYDGLRVDPLLVRGELSATDLESLGDGVIQPGEWTALTEPVRDAVRRHGVVALRRLAEWGAQLVEDIWSDIDARLGAPPAPAPASAQPPPNDPHELFLLERTRVFVGRSELIGPLLDYASSPRPSLPLVVTGVPGSGKSAVLAECARQCRIRMPKALVLPFFIGGAPGSTDLPSVLRGLCERLRDQARLRTAIPSDSEVLRRALVQFLERAGRKRRVVLVLAAVNQLDPAHRALDLDWLPAVLPRGVRMIVSTLPGPILEQLRSRSPEAVVEVPPLPETDRRTLVTTLLDRRGKRLTDEQLGRLLDTSARRDAALPLYLRVAVEELTLVGSRDALSERIDGLPAEVPRLFEQVLIRLESDHGRPLVDHVLRWIAASRSGLLESEIVELLKDHTPGVPRLEWAHLYRALDSYLRPMDEANAGLIGFFHDQLRAAVGRRYFEMDPAAAASSTRLLGSHAELAGLFETTARATDGAWQPEAFRALTELATHQMRAERWDDLERTLCDLSFVGARCRAGGVYELVDDYRAALEMLPQASEEARVEAESRQRCAQYARALAEYARASRQPGERPALPDPPPQCILTEEEIGKELRRIAKAPARVDRIRAFAGFVGAESNNLTRFGTRPGFPIAQAYNEHAGSPVGNAAETLVDVTTHDALSLRYARASRIVHDPHPLVLRTLSPAGDEAEGQDSAQLGAAADGGLAVSTFGTTLVVWDLVSGRRLRTFDDDQGFADAVALTPDGLWAVSGHGDSLVRVWNVDTGACTRVLDGHTDRPGAVAISADGLIVASAGSDRSVRAWDVDSGRCLWSGGAHSDEVTAIALAADGSRVVSGGGDETVRIWDARDGRCLKVLRKFKNGVRRVAIAPDGRQMIALDGDGTLSTWDMGTFRRIPEDRPHEDTRRAESVTLAADGRTTLAAGFGWLRLGGPHADRRLTAPAGSVAAITDVAATADLRRAISVTYDGTMHVWALDRGHHKPSDEEPYARESIDGLALRSDGRAMVILDRRGRLETPSVPDFRGFLVELGNRQANNDVGVTPDGERILVARYRDLRLYRAGKSAPHRAQMLAGHKKTVTRVAVAGDGRAAVTASEDRTLRIWDLAAPRTLRVLRGHPAEVNAVVFAPDARLVVSGGGGFEDKVPIISWDARTGRSLARFSGNRNSVYALAVTEDGQRTAAGGVEGVVRVWTTATGRLERELRGHAENITGLAATPYPAILVSTSRDRTVRAWNLDTGECMWVTCVPFVATHLAARAGYVVVAGQAGNVRVLELHTPGTAPRIATAVRVYEHALRAWSPRIDAWCPWCTRRFKASAGALEAIEALAGIGKRDRPPCVGLPAAAFEAPGLAAACAWCKRPVRFNPFVVDNPLRLGRRARK